MEFRKIQTIAFFVLLIWVGWLFFKMLDPYIFAIFWAAVIASIFYPVKQRIVRYLKNENISAFLTLCIALLVVIIPLAGVLSLVVKQSIDALNYLNDKNAISQAQSTVQLILDHPTVQNVVGDIDIQAKFQDKIREASSIIASKGVEWVKAGSQSTIAAIISTFIMLYTLYYFLKDGERWLRRVMHLLPFGDKNERVLYQKFVSTSKATLKGTVLIGGIQGTIGGIIFAIVGVPAAAFWGLVMIILSIIPAVGSFLVLYPAAIYFFLTGGIWQGVAIIVGSIIIGLVDNLLRPPLVGKDIEMHPLMIFFGTIGGLAVFGISGVVIGPIIAALFSAIVDMYEVRYKKELDSART